MACHWQLSKYTVTVPGGGPLGRAGLTDANDETIQDRADRSGQKAISAISQGLGKPFGIASTLSKAYCIQVTSFLWTPVCFSVT